MKKIYLTFLLLIFCQLSFGQSINLLKNGISIAKKTITVTGNSSDEDLVVHEISVVNTSNTPIEIRTKRYEISYVPNTYNFICWGICEAPFNHKGGKDSFYILNTSVKVTSVYDGFSGHYLPQETIGKSEYRYVFFDINNPKDSTWFNVIFSTNLTNTDDTQVKKEFKIYPNPVKETLKIEFYNDILTSGSIDIFSIMGQKITSLKQTKNESSVEWNLTDDSGNSVENGIYFCKIRLQNKLITQKIMVER